MTAPPPAEPETALHLLRAQLAALQQTAESQQADLRDLRQRLAAERQTCDLLRAEREALLASTSWRVTAPLRWLRQRVC